MSDNTILNNPVFWVSISGLIVGAYKFSLLEIYKSKCSSFKCCFNLLSVERNIEQEVKVDLETIHQEQKRSSINLEHQEQKEEV